MRVQRRLFAQEATSGAPACGTQAAEFGARRVRLCGRCPAGCGDGAARGSAINWSIRAFSNRGDADGCAPGRAAQFPSRLAAALDTYGEDGAGEGVEGEAEGASARGLKFVARTMRRTGILSPS